MQSFAWQLTLVVMLVIASIFGAVCIGASRGADVANPYRGRSMVFGLIVVVGIGLAVGTLSPWPLSAYSGAGVAPAKVIEAVGHQWRWEISDTEVPVGVPVEFRITASDVNHGFAVYKDRNRMLGQTQAMPGVVNRLQLTFDEPGQYEILCMEYCGLAHHAMVTTITAVANR